MKYYPLICLHEDPTTNPVSPPQKLGYPVYESYVTDSVQNLLLILNWLVTFHSSLSHSFPFELSLYIVPNRVKDRPLFPLKSLVSPHLITAGIHSKKVETFRHVLVMGMNESLVEVGMSIDSDHPTNPSPSPSRLGLRSLGSFRWVRTRNFGLVAPVSSVLSDRTLFRRFLRFIFPFSVSTTNQVKNRTIFCV